MSVTALWLTALAICGWAFAVILWGAVAGLFHDARIHQDRKWAWAGVALMLVTICFTVMMVIATYQMKTGGALDLSGILRILSGADVPGRVQ